MPDIAISVGSSDTLECLVYRIGLDKSEFVPGDASNGHVHIFHSGGADGGADTIPPSPNPAAALWDSAADMMKYDMVLLSCEGVEPPDMNQQALFDYAAAGGRVFANHMHYAWFYTGPFSTKNVATWAPGGNFIGDVSASAVVTAWDGTSFPRGQALHDWLANVQALNSNLLAIKAARHNADVSVINTSSQPWLVVDSTPTQPQIFSFDTPLGVPADKQCGRVVYTDMHVGASSADYNGTNKGTLPDGCVNLDLSPQEKALEFTIFDLSSCVTPDNTIQVPPGQK
jgi:hypothetical protein